MRERIDVIGVRPKGSLKDKPIARGSGLRICVELPHEFLVEGMNALVCALVPGGAAQRLEKSVSFLFVPRQISKPGRTIAPDRANWNAGSIKSGSLLSNAVLEHLNGHPLQPAALRLQSQAHKADTQN